MPEHVDLSFAKMLRATLNFTDARHAVFLFWSRRLAIVDGLYYSAIYYRHFSYASQSSDCRRGLTIKIWRISHV